jgi:hypothetical protein
MTKRPVTHVAFDTISPQADVILAVADLDLINLHFTTTDDVDKRTRGPGLKPRSTTKRKKGRRVTTYERPRKYTDMRLVWDKHLNRVDVDASLKNIGMTREQIDDMATKFYSIEATIKRAMRGRGY